MGAPAIASALRQTYEGIALGVPVFHDNSPDPADEPDSGVWVRFIVNAGGSAQVGIGGARKRRTDGIAEAWVFGDLDVGDKDVLEAAEEIAQAFRGGGADPVRYFTPTVLPRGRRGKWYAVQVLIPYNSDDDHPGLPAIAVLPAPAIDLIGVGEIAAVARTRFEATFPGIIALHDNDPMGEPDDAQWVRMTVQVTNRNQVQAGTVKKRYRTVGKILIQVFQIPTVGEGSLETGDKEVLLLAEQIATVFRSVSSPPVVFKSPTVTNALRGGRWWQSNVTIPYFADLLAAANEVALAPSIVSAAPTAGAEDFFYQHLFKAAGTYPIVWSLVTGSLPPGLALDPATGSLSGIPAVDGVYAFTIRATNTFGTDDQAVALTITDTTPAPVPLPDSPCLKGSGTPQGNVDGLLCQHYMQSDAQNLLWRCISDPSGTDWMLD